MTTMQRIEDGIVAYGREGHEWLVNRAANKYSQFGEDGIIAAIFERIGMANRWCFECGASDGVKLSNVRHLWEHGWECIQVECDREKFELLCLNSPGARNMLAKVGDNEWTLDTLLKVNEAPDDIDLVVLDIDGQEYWVLHDMERFTPRVLVVEYECPDRDSPPPARGETACKQAGSSATIGLLERKGYTVVCQTSCNMIAVRADLAGRLESQ